MSTKLHIKKGDTVYVNTGEDKGKTGRVLEVRPNTQRAIVEGINMVSKHTKPSAKTHREASSNRKPPYIYPIFRWWILPKEDLLV
jgi:large subunit ribosomal protein L24